MVRRPWMWCLLAALSLGAAPPAQDAADYASHALLENVLQNMRSEPTRQKERYAFTLDGRKFTLARLENGARLLIQTTSAAKPSLEALNRYNERIAVTTRAVRYGQDKTVLEAGLDCRLGVSEDGVRKFVAHFAKDARGFDDFLAKQPGRPDAAPAQPLQRVDEKLTPLPIRATPGSDDREIEITFPTNDGSAGETSWKIVWDIESGEQANKQGYKFSKDRKNSALLFKIKKAYFRPGPRAEWLQVLEDAHPQEFYVPYYFQNTRFFDLRDVGNYVRLHAREGGPRSKLLGKQQMVMAELRDRGLAYKHGDVSRRGEEFTLWANFQAGNYTYLVEFGFQDDGTIAFRHAPTGYNYFDHFDTASHMHNCLWRIGVRLAPLDHYKVKNRVQVVKLPFDPKGQGPAGKLSIQDLKAEGGIDWEGKEFTKVRVVNPDVSVFPADGKKARLPISYDLTALMQGQARHYRHKDEGFSAHDFWVTRPDTAEKMYINLGRHFARRENAKPLDGSDGVVLWHMSSALHVPRAEDGILQGNTLNNGQALVGWTVVELRPRNLFTRTPLYKR